MRSLSQSFSVLLPILYLLVVFYYGQIFFGRSKKTQNYSTRILIILLMIHACEIVLRWAAIGSVPLATKFDALSFLAFLIVTVYLIIELSVKTRGTGFFTVGLAFLFQTVSSMLYSWDLTYNPLLSNPVYGVHVVFTILGYTAICISALYALMYILLNHKIRNHQLGLIYEKMPSLQLLENMSIRSIQIGIIALGVGLLLGHLRAGAVLGNYWPMDIKVLLSDIIWLGYTLGYLFAQIRRWRGRWMAYLSLAGFAILVMTNIMTIFIENSFHRFQ